MREHAEDLLFETQLHWTDLFDRMQLVVLGLGSDGRVIFANPFLLSLTGYEKHEVIGADWISTSSSSSSSNEADEFKSVFSDVLAEPGERRVAPILTKQGRTCFISWFDTALRDRDGQMLGTLSIGEDITERAKATARIRAIGEVIRDILAETPIEEVLRSLAQNARELVGAEVATVALPVGDGQLVIAAADGYEAENLEGSIFPANSSMSGEVMRSGTSELIEDTTSDTRPFQPIVTLGGFGPAIFVPLIAHYQPIGTLAVANRQVGWGFAGEDVELLESFASQASIALEYARAQDELRRMIVVDERERVARDLHDVVIQRLFAVGLQMESISRYPSQDSLTSERLSDVISELDEIISSIRSTIFDLKRQEGDRGLRARILKAGYDAAGSLGFQPQVRFSGAVDSLISEELAHDVVAVVREALSNAARHAKPSRVIVDLKIGPDVLLLVRDDGLGFHPGNHRQSGLANLEARAGRNGGTFTINANEEGGTSLEWRVPLPSEEAQATRSP